MARTFFWTIRRHTFEAFYASPTGQALVQVASFGHLAGTAHGGVRHEAETE